MNDLLMALYSKRSTKLTKRSVNIPNPIKGQERLRPLLGKKVEVLDNAPLKAGTIVTVEESWKDNGYCYYLVSYKKAKMVFKSSHLGKIIKD